MPAHLSAPFPTTVYLGADDMIRLVQRIGLPACIAGVADRIERDFLRWNEFDKSARVASHSTDGVIELMPIADASHLRLQVRQRPPEEHRAPACPR